MKSACVILAEGCEEVEFITPVDYLRRAGVKTTVAALCDPSVLGDHAVILQADTTLDDIIERHELFDCVVIPGGNGARLIAHKEKAVQFILEHAEAGKLIAAICAAPALVLGQACSLLHGRRFSCYPGMETLVPEGIFDEARVVADGNILTSRGPGCAGEFSIAIIRALLGDKAAEGIAQKTLSE